MSKILKTHPKSVQAHKDLIMQCLDDKDESIRLRALDLLYGMVSPWYQLLNNRARCLSNSNIESCDGPCYELASNWSKNDPTRQNLTLDKLNLVSTQSD